MSLTKFTGDVDNIQSLPDKPTQTASQLKTLFDKTGADIKTYLNNTLTSEIDTALGGKAESSNVYAKADVYNKTETYSKTEVDDELNNYKLKDDFAVISGSHQFDGSTLSYGIPYPTGFNFYNCVIISIGRRYYEDNYNFQLSSGSIYIFQNHAEVTNYPYIIVLMKIS